MTDKMTFLLVGSREQRRANCVQKRSHEPKSRDDSFGTTLQRRCLEVLRFSLLFKHSVSACAKVLALRYLAYPPPTTPPKKKNINMLVSFFFKPAIDISVDFIGIKVTEEPYVSCLVSDRGERWFHADWDA